MKDDFAPMPAGFQEAFLRRDDPRPRMATMPFEQWQRLVSLIEARVPWDQEEVDELISKVRVV